MKSGRKTSPNTKSFSQPKRLKALHYTKKHPSQGAYFQILLLISIFDNRNPILRPPLYLAQAKKGW